MSRVSQHEFTIRSLSKDRARWDYRRATWRWLLSNGKPSRYLLHRCADCGAEYWGAQKGRRCDDCKFDHMHAVASTVADVHRIVARAIRKAQLPLPSEFRCTDCHKRAEVYDHRDYSKPLEVEPVCRGCNARRGPGKRRPEHANLIVLRGSAKAT